MRSRVTSVVIAGLGGQGVLKASDILAEAAFRAGYDVKKAEVHGMSQRGGSVNSDVRFGDKVYSPMISRGEADYLVVLAPDQVEPYRDYLREGGIVLELDRIDLERLGNKRTANVAMLGLLSGYLEIPEFCWREALAAQLRPELVEVNLDAFGAGRSMFEEGGGAMVEAGKNGVASGGEFVREEEGRCAGEQP